MKRITVFILFLFTSLLTQAQVSDPVRWTFTANKLEGNVYEVHMTATISSGWHIYSQNTPDGGPLPTNISFFKNPLITLEGKVAEVGKLEQKFEKIFNVDVWQYSNKVDFVQKLKVKGKAKTLVAGEIESMCCDDHQCLPPKTVKFSIAIK